MPQLRTARAAAERRSASPPQRPVGDARQRPRLLLSPREISGYKRFRSVESVDYCEHFEPEPDADRIARRFETVRILRAAFDQWRKELQSKAKTK